MKWIELYAIVEFAIFSRNLDLKKHNIARTKWQKHVSVVIMKCMTTDVDS
jgi:hypothetical protein